LKNLLIVLVQGTPIVVTKIHTCIAIPKPLIPKIRPSNQATNKMENEGTTQVISILCLTEDSPNIEISKSWKSYRLGYLNKSHPCLNFEKKMLRRDQKSQTKKKSRENISYLQTRTSTL